MSSASISLTQARLNDMSSAQRMTCCGLLNELEPWQHEAVIYRDNELAWTGPIIQDATGLPPEPYTIEARDLFQWFERRILDRHRTFDDDLAVIFRQYVSDGLHHDPSPSIDFTSISPTGIIGEREMKVESYTRAADALREIARVGLDFTMIGRAMVAGGGEVPTGHLGTLVAEDFVKLKANRDGLQAETESALVGARPENIGAPLTATAGGFDPVRGLLQSRTDESSINDQDSLQAAADTRHALLNTSPWFITGTLAPAVAVNFSQLIPGATTDLRLGLTCKEIIGTYRLMQVDVTVQEDGAESVDVTFSSLGSVSETV